MAMMFKVLDQEAKKSKSLIEEEKKEEEPAKVEAQKPESSTVKTDIFAVIDEAIAMKPWRKCLEEEKSGLATMVKVGPQAFRHKLKVLVDIANELKLVDAPIEDFLSLPLVNGNKELMAAILLQNVMQPKNAQRREAITSKIYNELSTAS
jgi:hypothetical protein